MIAWLAHQWRMAKCEHKFGESRVTQVWSEFDSLKHPIYRELTLFCTKCGYKRTVKF